MSSGQSALLQRASIVVLSPTSQNASEEKGSWLEGACVCLTNTETKVTPNRIKKSNATHNNCGSGHISIGQSTLLQHASVGALSPSSQNASDKQVRRKGVG